MSCRYDTLISFNIFIRFCFYSNNVDVENTWAKRNVISRLVVLLWLKGCWITKLNLPMYSRNFNIKWYRLKHALPTMNHTHCALHWKDVCKGCDLHRRLIPLSIISNPTNFVTWTVVLSFAKISKQACI